MAPSWVQGAWSRLPGDEACLRGIPIRALLSSPTVLLPDQRGPTAMASLLTVANVDTPPQGRASPAARNAHAVSKAQATTRRTQAVASCLPAVAVRKGVALPAVRRYVAFRQCMRGGLARHGVGCAPTLSAQEARQSRDIARAQLQRDELLKRTGMRIRGLHLFVAVTAAAGIALLGLTGTLATSIWASTRELELNRMDLAGILARTTSASWWASRASRPAV